MVLALSYQLVLVQQETMIDLLHSTRRVHILTGCGPSFSLFPSPSPTHNASPDTRQKAAPAPVNSSAGAAAVGAGDERFDKWTTQTVTLERVLPTSYTLWLRDQSGVWGASASRESPVRVWVRVYTEAGLAFQYHVDGDSLRSLAGKDAGGEAGEARQFLRLFCFDGRDVLRGKSTAFQANARWFRHGVPVVGSCI